MEIYSRLEEIPSGNASEKLTPGCLVLEGGAWRGLYTQGVLDVFMENDLNIQTVIGTSAGAMAGMSYVSGQIGRAARFNLRHRHDRHYVGVGALLEDHGITGFSYLFRILKEEDPINEERFFDPARRFVVTATNIETGETEYFDRDACDIEKAVQASATVPYVSEAVWIGDKRYLDGGIGVKIPYQWALDQGFEKILVIRTRDRNFRKPVHRPLGLTRREYRHYPLLKKDLMEEAPRYNVLVDNLNLLEEQGRLKVLAPSRPVDIRRFEGDMEVLGDIYFLGRRDALDHLDEIRAYFGGR